MQDLVLWPLCVLAAWLSWMLVSLKYLLTCYTSYPVSTTAVPVSSAVAGVACGLVCKECDGDGGDIDEYTLLTDISVRITFDLTACPNGWLL